MLKDKTKNKLKFALIMLLVAILLCGIGISIYFIVISRSPSEILSSREKNFGEAVKSSSLAMDEKRINLTDFSDDLTEQNIIFISDQFAVTYDDNDYSYYSFDLSSFVEINKEVDNIDLLVGNLVILNVGNDKILYDLANLCQICDLSNAMYEDCGNRLLIKSVDGTALDFKENGEDVANLYAVLVDVVSVTRVMNFSADDDIIDIRHAGDFLIVYSTSETALYRLDQTLSKVASFENTLSEGTVYNIASALTSKTYLGVLYNKLYALGKNLFLVERTYSVSQQQYMIKTVLSDSSEKYFSMSYSLFDAVTGFKYDFDNKSDVVLSAFDAGINENYIAIVRSGLINKSYAANTDKDITYYEVVINSDSIQLYPIVTYDYVKYGKIVGFVGTKLLTSGGLQSGLLDFKGQQSDDLSLEYGQKITSSEFSSKAFVMTSVSGLKGVKDVSGKILHESIYVNISPIMDNRYVAEATDGYYLLDLNGEKVKIEAFATEYENFVFAGIGYYLTKNADSTYNVYKVDGTIKYAGVNVVINYQNASNQVIINIVGQEVLYITPLKSVGQAALLSVSAQNANVVNNVKATIISEDDFTFVGAVNTEVHVDTASGMGQIDIGYTATMVEAAANFRNYASLTTSERALIPSFDEGASYNDVTNNRVYTFSGAYFVKIGNGVLAVIRLAGDDSKTYYMLNISLVDSYLSGLQVNYTLSGINHNAVCFDATGRNEQNINLSSDPCAGSSLNYLVGMISEQTAVSSRLVNYAFAGLDGGVIFVTDEADTISVNLTLQNAYHISAQNSEIFDWDYLSDGDIIDCGHYTLTVEKSALERSVTLQARNGYFFTTASVVSVIDDGSISGDVEYSTIATLDTINTSFEVSFNNISEDKFQISNLSMIERYNLVNFLDEDKSTRLKEEQTFYFYGYGDDVSLSRNPAAFGFNNFYRAVNNVTGSKTGYNFTGFAVTIDSTDYQVFDENGEFLLTNRNLLAYTGNNVETVNMFATYEAKTYTITYKSNGTFVGQTYVKYDQRIDNIEEMLVPSAYTGHDFIGWKYGETTLTNESIYQYSVEPGIEVQAVWQPKTYTVTFNSNLNTYQSLNIGGFTYKITDVYYANDFGGALIDDPFISGTQKTITFGGTYGTLPDLNAQNKEGTNTIKFTFLGWYSAADYVNMGIQITSDTEVTDDPPITTLYAHYARNLYSANMSVSVSDYVVKNGMNVTPFDRMTYAGASQAGVKTSYSTRSISGYAIWAQSGGVYSLYNLRNEDLNFNIYPNDGYYVSSILIKYYLNDGSTQNKNITGSYNVDNYNYSVSYDIANLTCSVDGVNIGIVFQDIDGAYFNNNQFKFVDITVNFAVKTFKNTITLAKSTERNGESVTATGFNLSAIGSASHSGIKYDVTTNYSLNIPSVNTYKLNRYAKNSYLNKFKVGSQEITFEPIYTRENGVSYFKLNSSSAGSSTVTSEELIYTYVVGGVTLKVIYNITNQNYTYEFETKNSGDNYSITLTLKDALYDVALNITNVSSEGNIYDVNVTAKEYPGNITLDEVTDGYEKENNFAGNTILFEIATNLGCFVNTMRINLGGINYNIAISETSIVASGLSVTNSFMTDTDYFTTITNGKALIGGGLFITYNAGVYQIGVAKVFGDVTINLSVRNYTILRVDVSQANNDCFDLIINDGIAGYVNKSFAEVASSEPTYFVNSTIDNIMNYVIFGKEQSATSLQLTTKSTAMTAYKIINSAGSASVSASKEQALITRSAYAGSVSVGEINRNIDIVSYVGTGAETYRRDLTDMLSEIYISYYDINGNYVQDYQYNTDETITFGGKAFSIKVYDIVGYKFKSLILQNQTGDIISPSNADWATKKSDAYENYYYQYDFMLNDLNFMSFDLTIYQDAIKYQVKYNKIDAGSSQVTGETENSLHYYNIPSVLSANCYEKTGYTFVGYSLNPNAETGEYASGQMLSENLSATDDDIVNMYAIFTAKEYLITYDYHKGSGSSLPSEASSSYFVTFDESFPALFQTERTGYNFAGWWTQPSGGYHVSEGDSFVKTLYDELTKNESALPKPTITLYAHWEAKIYNVKYNHNDAIPATGSSSAELDPSGPVEFTEVVTFDELFGTLKSIVRVGHTFKGWYTKASGASVSKIDSNSGMTNTIYNELSVNGDFSDTISDRHITLFAQWDKKTYTIIFDSNDQDGGSTIATSHANGWVKFDSTFRSRDFSSVITRTGYSFAGWWTKSDNSGIEIRQSYTFNNNNFDEFTQGEYDTVNSRESIILYARWQKNEYTINYVYNKGEGSSDPSTASETYSVNFDSAFGELFGTTRTGYNFVGWFTHLNEGTQISSNTILDIDLYNILKENGDFSDTPSDRHITLFAHWSKKIYTIVYDYNKGEGSSDPVQTTDVYSVTFDETFPVLYQTSRIGYNFIGWFINLSAENSVTPETVLTDALYASLTKPDATHVKLFAKWQARVYSIIYNDNDVDIGYGSTKASIKSGGAASVEFDALFPTLTVYQRTGYTFKGLFVSTVSDDKVEKDTKFDVALYNKLTKNENLNPPRIFLYAQWDVITYTMTINKNDSGEGTGSTSASRLDGQALTTISITFEQGFTMPALTRIGYDFLGFKYAKMGTDTEGAYDFIGGRWTSGNTLNETLNQAMLTRTNIQLDDEHKICTIYAVWSPKTFHAYVDLNDSDLEGYSDSETGEPLDSFILTVENGGSLTEYAGVTYTGIYLDWKFDARISYLPNIIPTGYNFDGYKTVNDGSGTKFIANNTVLNYDLFNVLTYTDENGDVENTSNLYGQGSYNFSMYATYSVKSYNITLDNGSALTGYNLQILTGDKNTYMPAAESSFNSLSIEYGKSAIIDLWAAPGKYISQITVEGSTWSETLSFGWKSADKKVSYNGSNITTSFRLLSVLRNKGAEKTYLKALYDAGVAQDTPRLIFALMTVQESITITIDSVEDQAYSAEFCRYAKGDATISTISDKLFKRNFTYNAVLENDNFDYPYTKGFVFKGWYYGQLSGGSPVDPSEGNLVDIGFDTVKDDLVLVAYYEVAETKAQVVNFHIWDNIEGGYVSRPDIDAHYQLYYYDSASGVWSTSTGGEDVYYDTDGMSGSRVNAEGGKLLTLPTPAAEIWPAGTYFAGYVISDSAPAANKYYSYLDGPNCINVVTNNLQEFNIYVMVEEHLNVYAVYNAYKFQIHSGEVAGNIMPVTLDLELYEFKEGRTYKFDYNDVYFVVLNNAQYQTFNSLLNSGNTKESALYTALGNTLDNIISADSITTNIDVSGGTYVVGFVKETNNLDNDYVYLVSQNVLSIS